MPDRVKEKLVEIVCEGMEDGCVGHCNHPPCFQVERVVNALLENGVTVHPCEVGQEIWLVFTPKHPANPNDKGRWFILQDGVQRIIYGKKGVSIETWNMGTIPAKEIGKKIFFTREEAESHLPQPPKGE